MFSFSSFYFLNFPVVRVAPVFERIDPHHILMGLAVVAVGFLLDVVALRSFSARTISPVPVPAVAIVFVAAVPSPIVLNWQ